MIQRLLASMLFAMLMPLASMAQMSIVADGMTVAHGVEAHGEMPPALEACLRGRDHAMTYQPAGPLRTIAMSTHAVCDGRAVGNKAAAKSGVTPTVGPLLKSVRDQKAPYNWMCPLWTYDDGRQSEERCLSGCVATCIEQLLAYYRYPEALQDTLHGWATPHYVIDDMLPGTRFDWDSYLYDYRGDYTQAQGEAIALVSLAAGMAVHMNYGLSASGASLWNAEEPLRNALGYGMVRIHDRVLYSPSRWHAILQNELRQGRPVAYAAHTMDISGHAFNIDGVDANGFYHVNWGYNGNYDGWYDLDWLDPWERDYHPANSMVMGFFSNHAMLVMHPTAEARPLETDTFRIDSLGIRLHDIRFLRQPDKQGYIPADFDFENTSRDTVTYTYEVMSFLPTDTAVFLQADYVGLATLTLLPGERRTQRTYLQFDAVGERILGISHDDITIPYTQDVSIGEGTPSRLQWGEATMSVDATEATFTIAVANTAPAGIAGDLVTHCLRPDDVDEDSRHYDVLCLAAGADTTITVRFRDLRPDTRYTYRLRCPWAVQAQLEFTTPPADGIVGTKYNTKRNSDKLWDVNGQPATRRSRIVIQNGRKHILEP